jgi:hypothetical protein
LVFLIGSKLPSLSTQQLNKQVFHCLAKDASTKLIFSVKCNIHVHVEINFKHLNTYVQGDICSHTELLSFYICTILLYNYHCTRASGDLPRLLCKVVDVVGKDGSLLKLACPYGILNSLYDMGDLELLNSVINISHWVETPISFHAAAKQASVSLLFYVSMYYICLPKTFWKTTVYYTKYWIKFKFI